MDDQMIINYLKAMASLYGAIPAEDALEIINDQNPGDDPVSMDRLEKLDLDETYVVLEYGYIAHEALLVFDESEDRLVDAGLQEVIAAQDEKPFYIPERDALLKFGEGSYFERPPAFQELLDFIVRELATDSEKAEGICEDLQIGFVMSYNSPAIVLDELNRRNISFRDDAQVNQLLRLANELANHTRMWANRGFTPRELFEKYDRPALLPLPDEPFDFAAALAGMDGQMNGLLDDDEDDEDGYGDRPVRSEMEDSLIGTIISLVNLYGVVSEEKALEIFNSQNGQALTAVDIEAMDLACDLADGFVERVDDLYVQDSLLMDDESLPELLARQAGKPYYVPGREALLKYRDDFYMERPPAFDRLKAHILKHDLTDESVAEELCEDIQLACMHADLSAGFVQYEFTRRKLRMDDDNLRQLMPLVMDLANHTRMWIHRGFTPAEMRVKTGGKPAAPGQPMPALSGAQSAAVPGGAKVGRNEPCPCGSGRKYKQCCGR